ncbi:hypothetical protein SteCoe_35792 [Stentor coeruleus]|uniref:Uncharacterized protein n=1 Tax=Stentor coeruleus TaxID=5963 RepID=A0A1R2ARL4_9CILI|nr:hypothetical protein SteCoe_35792 [Stentor coeruleus]
MQQPVNKHLQKIWDTKLQELHQEKLKSIKSRVDFKKPFRYSHLEKNAKKEQQLEDRCTEIERENRILLEKMSKIMATRSKSFSKIKRNLSVRQNERKRASSKIFKDNIFLVKRLQNQSSEYSQSKFEEDRKQQECLLHRISEYPYTLGSNKKIPKTTKAAKNHKQKKLVYLKSQRIGERFFEFEIYKDKKKIIVIAFDSEEMFKLRFPYENALRIMGEKGRYDLLIDKLKYKNGNLILTD